MLVDDEDNLQAGCQIIQSGNSPEVGNDPFPLWLRDEATFAALGYRSDDVVEAAEVLLPYDLGLAVYPLALPGVVVGPSTDRLLG